MGRPRRHGYVFTKSEGLDHLRRLHKRDGYISCSQLFEDKKAPSAVWYRKEFGSLSAACKAAGLEHNADDRKSAGRLRMGAQYRHGPSGVNTPPAKKLRRLDDQQLLDGVRRLFNAYGRISTRLINNDPMLPSMSAIRRRYVSIYHLYAAAGLPVRPADPRFQVGELLTQAD